MGFSSPLSQAWARCWPRPASGVRVCIGRGHELEIDLQASDLLQWSPVESPKLFI